MPPDADSLNITFDLLQRAESTPQKPALILSGNDINYQTLNKWVWQATHHLYDSNVREGQVVSTLMKNELLRIIYSLAIMRLGATLLPVTNGLTQAQMRRLHKEASTQHIATDISLTSNALNIIKVSSTTNWKNSGHFSSSILSKNPVSYCIIVFGSGSTGTQKLIPQTHAQLRKRCRIAFPPSQLEENQRVLSLTNTEFAAGINRLLSIIHIGGAMAVADASVKSLKEYCDRKGITTLFSSVFHIETILAEITDEQPSTISSLKSLRLSGSSISMELRNRIREKITPHLHISYGANECGRISIATPPQVYECENSVGYPLPGVEVEIFDSQLNKLGNGVRGHIRVRSRGISSHYINDANATKKSFRDGWFYTGDIGEISPEGDIRHFGRSDRMMIFNGINIHPIELEKIVKAIPGVKDVVALPLKNSVHQDIPICVVTLDTNTTINSETVLQLASERLGFMAPKEIVVLNKIPRNDNGKLQAKELLRLVNEYLKQRT